MENTKKERRSFFELPFMRTRIKSSNVSLFPEAALGYLLGPLLALICNGVVNIWLIQYWDKVLGLGKWNPVFETILPIASAILIVIGNLLVGKLMERKPSIVGKARPLILLGMPLIAVALLVLFIVPLPQGNGGGFSNIAASVLIAVGYNLYYAFAWPMYYTSSNSLVSLSTRDGGKRGLLGTAIMAGQLGAAGLAGMAGGLLVDLIGLLPKYKLPDGTIVNQLPSGTEGVDFTTIISAQDANSKWFILMIVMIVCLVLGCLLIYYFTRERITEEQVQLANSGKNTDKEVKKITMKEQMKICIKDKYWWFIIIFFFLYQFGGQMKNNDLSFYSQAFTNGSTSLSSLINTVGAIPTALGMVIVWPLAKKFTKAKTIAMGGVLAFAGSLLAFLAIAFPEGVWGISVASFCIKAIGTAPAMYISLALLANVLDHQEAVHGVRTDGFSMAVYGSIMVAMSGICNGIIVGLNSCFGKDVGTQRILHSILGFGVEGVCYLAMAVIFIFMAVERFTRVDLKAIHADQKEKVLAIGGKWIEPEEKARLEDEENARIVEEQRIAQLKIDCEKKHLDFDKENKAYLEKAEAAKKAKEEKAAAAKAKKEAKEAALSEEEKAARKAKAEAKTAKEAKNDEEALKELNAIRASFQKSEIKA